MKTILVIEDDKLFRGILSEKISGAGFNVILAVNGEEGITQIKTNGDNIDLIILDLLMPKMDGITFFYNLKKSTSRNIPTIILTNLTEASYQDDVSEFLIKSNVSLDEIIQKIKKHTQDPKK